MAAIGRLLAQLDQPLTISADAQDSGEYCGLINLSVRAAAGAGGESLIAGFVIDGAPQKRVLVRAIGPGLQGFGDLPWLRNPRLTLHAGDQPIHTNDDWDSSEETVAAMKSAGAFDLSPGSRDSVILITLVRGAYTAVISSADDSVGVALVEVYELPDGI